MGKGVFGTKNRSVFPLVQIFKVIECNSCKLFDSAIKWRFWMVKRCLELRTLTSLRLCKFLPFSLSPFLPFFPISFSPHLFHGLLLSVRSPRVGGPEILRSLKGFFAPGRLPRTFYVQIASGFWTILKFEKPSNQLIPSGSNVKTEWWNPHNG